MNPTPTIDAMRTAARTLSGGDVREKLHAVQAAQDALDAIKAELLAELEMTKDYEIDGASTLNAWVRIQLRLNPKQASILVSNAIALRDLPLVAEAALSGRISAAHVQAFVFGLKQVGLEPMLECQEAFVDVAMTCEPAELFEVVKLLKDKVHPEELDQAWHDGMDKEDFQIIAVPDGWHISGFLNTVTGAKVKKVIDAISAPRDKDDTRSGSQRRVQGIDDLCEHILAGGLPSDKGVRPHLSVIVDAETLQAAVESSTATGQPAQLAGFGSIGPNLLSYLACVSDFTPILTQKPGDFGQSRILNVGRSHRAPTLKQRRAVLARQGGICAAPGCHHTHLEIHHSIWWSNGGPTDLDLLVGLCVRCHHLLHRGSLHITGNAVDGFTFTNRSARPLHRRRQTSYPQAA